MMQRASVVGIGDAEVLSKVCWDPENSDVDVLNHAQVHITKSAKEGIGVGHRHLIWERRGCALN